MKNCYAYILLLFLFSVFSQQLIAQQISLGWARQFENPTQNCISQDIAVSDSGYVYVVGRFAGTTDFDPAGGGLSLTSAGSEDAFVAKLDQNGSPIWVRQFGSTSADRGYSIAVDDSGNVYSIGTYIGTVDFDPGAGTFNMTNSNGGYGAMFISKLDANGNFVWALEVDGSNSINPDEIVLNDSFDLFIVGAFEGPMDFNPGSAYYPLSSVNSTDGFVLQLDRNGNFIEAMAVVQGNGQNAVSDIDFDQWGNRYITGSFASVADFNPSAGTFNITGVQDRDAFVVKLDANGNFLWAEAFQGNGNQWGNAICVHDSGTVILGGVFNTTTDFDPGTSVLNITSAGASDMFVLQLDSSGALDWVKPLGGTSFDDIYDLWVDDEKNIYHTGTFSDSVDFDPDTATYALIAAGNLDYYVQKMSPSGKHLWASGFGSAYSEYANAIVTGSDHSVYTTGIFRSTIDFDPDTSTFELTSGAIYQDGFVHKLIQCYSSSQISVLECDSFIAPSGQIFYTSGTYEDVIPNAAGCDSIITIHLTIGANEGTDSIGVCSSYTWPLNGQTYTATGVYTAITTNSNGCDSTVTLKLTINDDPINTQIEHACGSYTWPVNGVSYSASGVYSESFTNVLGCDSSFILDLTIGQNNSQTVSISACNSYLWAATGLEYTNSGTYTTTVTNASGCDSSVTLDLTVTSIDTSVSHISNTLSANQAGAAYLWLDCWDEYEPIAWATSQTFNPGSSGYFAVEISMSECVDTSNCHFFSVVGIGGEYAENAFRVYPNPTPDMLYLSIPHQEIFKTIIYDVSGNQVMINSNSTSLDVSNLLPGIYSVQISTKTSFLSATFVKF
ncbi:MAG: SBBP repeat-containing protein [Flavobacteriales bacterium]